MDELENKFLKQVVDLFRNAKKNMEKTVNMTMVYSYYEAGRMIIEEEQQGKERAEYGKYIIKKLSEGLTKEFGSGFSIDTLKLMRRFYVVFSEDSIGETAFPQSEKLPRTKEGRKFYLSWSNYITLMRIRNIEERHFYEIEAYRNGWNTRELARQYGSSLYERLALSRDKDEVMKLALQGQMIEKPGDLFKDPLVLEFTGLPELVTYSETDLETKIIDNLQKFLLELGRGFTFVGRQVRFTFEEEHYRVDLVFYNRLLRCFVLFDLKIGQLKHQDIGQMQMYVNYYDRKVKLEEENRTIGIIICKDKKDAVVEMTLPEDNSQIFASKYQTVLPSKEELKRLIADKDIES